MSEWIQQPDRDRVGVVEYVCGDWVVYRDRRGLWRPAIRAKVGERVLDLQRGEPHASPEAAMRWVDDGANDTPRALEVIGRLVDVIHLLQSHDLHDEPKAERFLALTRDEYADVFAAAWRHLPPEIREQSRELYGVSLPEVEP